MRGAKSHLILSVSCQNCNQMEMTTTSSKTRAMRKQPTRRINSKLWALQMLLLLDFYCVIERIKWRCFLSSSFVALKKDPLFASI